LILDDSLAEAYAVLAAIAFTNREWAEGEAHDLRAIVSEPKNSTAHLWRGENLISVGRVSDALEEALIAYQLDPLHPGTNTVLAGIYFFLNDMHNTLKYGAAAWDLGHSGGLRVQVLANLRLGEVDRALELAEQYDEQRTEIFKSRMTILTLLIEAKTDTAKEPVFLEKLAQNELALPFRFLVSSYAGLGQIDEAYRVVNHRLGSHSADAEYAWSVLWGPDMAAFRQDPRFTELVSKLGLLDYWHEHGWPDACRPAGVSLICA
jgi:tetratricopeptide (TPR) repeat protein